MRRNLEISCARQRQHFSMTIPKRLKSNETTCQAFSRTSMKRVNTTKMLSSLQALMGIESYPQEATARLVPFYNRIRRRAYEIGIEEQKDTAQGEEFV